MRESLGNVYPSGNAAESLKKTHDRSDGKNAAKAEAKGGDSLVPSQDGTRLRRLSFRLGAACLVPLLLLAVVEAGLRLTGFGYDSGFWVHHAAAPAGAVVENQRFSWRFFPHTLARHPGPLVVRPQKPAGVYRIIVFGESAAEGDPAPAFGFARILRILLESEYPAVRFEVVNVAFTAISSHVILPIARDCAAIESDLWLVYMGNNEVIGPYGVGTVFSEQALPLPVIRAALALKRLRLGQLVEVAVDRLRPSEDAAKGWGGMTMFAGRRFRPEDPRLRGVYANFQRNLNDIIRVGKRSGAEVMVSTMAGNLRDWPPFASLHRPDLTGAQSES